MDVEEFKRIIREVLNENKPSEKNLPRKEFQQRKVRKKAMEFSKKIMIFASVTYAATWLIAVISWFRMQLLPDELMKYSTFLYGVALAVYGGKSAYENKPKIEAIYESTYGEQDGVSR